MSEGDRGRLRGEDSRYRAEHLLAIWVLVVAVTLALLARPFYLRLRWAFRSEAVRVAELLAAQLRSEDPGPGPVERSGSEVKILGGKVRLTVRGGPKDHGGLGKQASVHVHVAALVPGGPDGGVDACISGKGTTRGEARSDAADTYRAWALPALAAVAGAKPGQGAASFSGTETWGVPGFRGYAGRLGRVGELPAETFRMLVGAALFAGMATPDDGGVHLAKVTLAAKGKAWRRTVELDGKPTSIRNAPWTGVPAPGEEVAVVRFAAFRRADAEDRPEVAPRG